MHNEASYRLTENPDTLATSHCQQCFGRKRAAQVIGIVVDVPFDEQLPSKF